MHNIKEQGPNVGGEEFGPTFDKKDVIGCGFHIEKRFIFFTKNGAFIDEAYKNISIPKTGLFPSVCMQSNSH